MAGGVLERPFSLNVKCIVTSFLVGGGYWFLPKKSYWVLVFLFWVSYVGLSWYDELYDCKNQMKPTLFPLGRLFFLPFKPQSYKTGMENLSERQLALMDRVDHLTVCTLLFCTLVFVFSRTS